MTDTIEHEATIVHDGELPLRHYATCSCGWESEHHRAPGLAVSAMNAHLGETAGG
jgi:hypothetical protein